jgi:hypothetical protein
MAWRDSEAGSRGRRGRTCEVIGLYTAKGYHPSDYCRPWCDLEWRRIIDYDHACQYVQRLADVIFSPGPRELALGQADTGAVENMRPVQVLLLLRYEFKLNFFFLKPLLIFLVLF